MLVGETSERQSSNECSNPSKILRLPNKYSCLPAEFSRHLVISLFAKLVNLKLIHSVIHCLRANRLLDLAQD